MYKNGNKINDRTNHALRKTTTQTKIRWERVEEETTTMLYCSGELLFILITLKCHSILCFVYALLSVPATAIVYAPYGIHTALATLIYHENVRYFALSRSLVWFPVHRPHTIHTILRFTIFNASNPHHAHIDSSHQPSTIGCFIQSTSFIHFRPLVLIWVEIPLLIMTAHKERLENKKQTTFYIQMALVFESHQQRSVIAYSFVQFSPETWNA